MTELDILAAFDNDAAVSDGRCVIGRWLDTIPDDQPGKGRLVAALTELNVAAPDYETLHELRRIVRKLGKRTSESSLGLHRTNRCGCE